MRGTQILAEGHGDAWLAGRRKGLGGTDTVVLMGAGSYDDETPYFVWLKKTEGYDIPMNGAMERGHALEPVVLDRYVADTGHEIVDTGLWQHAEHEMVLASPDALVVEDGEIIGGVEAKTTLDRTARKWDGECPARFEWQSRHYMAVLDVPWWDVVCIVIDTWEVYHWRIERDMDKERGLLAACSEFWRTYIEPGIPPEPESTMTPLEVARRYVTATEKPRDLDSHTVEGAALAAMLEDRREAARVAKEAKDQMAKIDADLKALAAESDTVTIDGVTAYTWKSASRSTIDTKRLKAEHPEIAEEYSRQTAYRTLSVK